MAATSEAEQEIARHADTYGFFTGLMKWGTIVSALVTIVVIFIIAT